MLNEVLKDFVKVAEVNESLLKNIRNYYLLRLLDYGKNMDLEHLGTVILK